MKWKLDGAARWMLAAMVALTAWGCSGKTVGTLVGNERPQVQLTARPQPGDSVYFKVRLQWTASDADGKVEYFIYNVDPPLSGDTTWTRIDRNETTIFFKSSTPRVGDTDLSNGLFPPFAVSSRDYHEFVIKAVDNEGGESPPTTVSFTSRTVAPVTQILSPVNGRGVTRSTAPSVRIEWRGVDADREGEGQAGPPRMYKFKLVTQTQIQQAEKLGSSSPSAADIQHFFTTDGGPPSFANWDSVSSDTTFKQYEALTPGQIWFFAVVAFDIAGAYEPRFNLDNNVLRFKPSTELQAPSIVVFNSFFIRSQGNKGYFDLSESRVVRIQVPEGEPIPFNWDAVPATGTVLAGFRWVLDPIDGDIFNEAARENDTQTYRWSSWSTSEQSATLGPFFQVTTVGGQSDTTVFHRFYIEARDNTGAISIMIIELEVVRALFKDPTQARNILFFDDFRGDPDRPDHQPYANFPIESALDTLMYAVGGNQYQFRPPGTLSNPGIFAGYFSDPTGKIVSDTLDYRFLPTTGLPLSVMARYKAIVWYTDAKDAGRTGSKNGSQPECALRFANDFGQLNGLAVYLSQGGKAFLFGSGSVQAIANGYVTRFGNTNPAPPPYASPTGNSADRTHILWPGNFLYDYMFVRSQMDIADQAGVGNGTGSDTDNYMDFIPYLPQFQCPGAPWPPDGWTGQRTATCDPRVGPASAANAAVWDGLPQLHMQTEFNTWPTRPPQSIVCYFVSNPDIITPNVGELDTLYLGRAKAQLIRGARDNPDGKPVWFHCTGLSGWELNWTSIPIWYLDRTELRSAVDKILGKWGFTRNTNPLTQTGPGGVELTASEKMGSENP